MGIFLVHLLINTGIITGFIQSMQSLSNRLCSVQSRMQLWSARCATGAVQRSRSLETHVKLHNTDKSYIYNNAVISVCHIAFLCEVNSTTDFGGWCTRSYTGWTSLSESVTSWACWITGVYSAKRHCTCPLVASRSPKSQHVGIYKLRCTSSADRSATSSQHLQSSGIRCRWSHDV